MTDIRFESEEELIEGIKQSVCKEFSSKYLGPKIKLPTGIRVMLITLSESGNMGCVPNHKVNLI